MPVHVVIENDDLRNPALLPDLIDLLYSFIN